VGRRGVRAILGLSAIIWKGKCELEQFWEKEQLCTILVVGKRGVTVLVEQFWKLEHSFRVEKGS
jgi:hypothetical protein